jgi:hypothetical protein
MASNNLYRVTYHFETGGKKVSEIFQDNVLAATQDYNTIAAVLSGNSRTNNNKGTLVIVSIQHLAGTSNVLS